MRTLDVVARAKIPVMRAVGYKNNEIAKELGVTEANITYHVQKLRSRAEQVGPEVAMAEVLMGSVPFYPLADILSRLNAMRK